MGSALPASPAVPAAALVLASMPSDAAVVSAEGVGGLGLRLLLVGLAAVLLGLCRGGVAGGGSGRGHNGAKRLTSKRTSIGLQQLQNLPGCA